MSKKRNKKNRYFQQKPSSVATGVAMGISTATAVMEMPAPAGYAEPEYIPPAPESDLTPEEEAELLAEIRNMPDSYPTDEEIAEFQAEYPSEPSYEQEEVCCISPAVIAMDEIFKAVNELNAGDFTDSFLALSKKAEKIAEYGRRAFIRHYEDGNEMVDMDMVYEFNQAAMRTPTKHGILSAFVMHDSGVDAGWEDNWKSVDILMIERERWNTAYKVEDFSLCVPVANKGMTTAELFEETRKRYAEYRLN